MDRTLREGVMDNVQISQTIVEFDPHVLSHTCWLVLSQNGKVLRHINHCWLFNAKSGLYIYISYDL